MMHADIRPMMPVTGIDGNVFMLTGAARATLRRAGQFEAAQKMTTEVLNSTSYYNACATVFQYVTPIFTKTPLTAGQQAKPFANLHRMDGTHKALIDEALGKLLNAHLQEWYWEAVYRLMGVTDYEHALKIVFEYVEPVFGPTVEEDNYLYSTAAEPVNDEDYDDSDAY